MSNGAQKILLFGGTDSIGFSIKAEFLTH